MAETEACLVSSICENVVLCNVPGGSGSESLESTFPAGLINCGKNLLNDSTGSSKTGPSEFYFKGSLLVKELSMRFLLWYCIKMFCLTQSGKQ